MPRRFISSINCSRMYSLMVSKMSLVRGGGGGATAGAVVLRTTNVGSLDHMSIFCSRVVASLYENPLRFICEFKVCLSSCSKNLLLI